ncbi:MAG: MAPEG family protein [Myxococcota bacterium]
MFETYASSIAALGAVAGLLLLQVLVADVVGILRRHTPGTAVEGNHSELLFRVSRTVANANESIAVFVCAWLFCVLGGASPELTAWAAWAYLAFRCLYAVCYYANWQLLRSVCFGLSVLALAALVGVGVFA